MIEHQCKRCEKKITEREYNSFQGYCYQCYEILLKENEKKKKIENWLKTLPKKFQKIQNEDAKKYKGNSLFLFGNTNTGKTVLATSILKQNWENGKQGKYVKFTELITQLQFSENKERLLLLDKIAKFLGLIVLDDFGGIGKTTDFVRQISYYIISYREENELQTIITSNLSLEELGKEIDIRISSRIRRMCGNIIEMKKKVGMK